MAIFREKAPLYKAATGKEPTPPPTPVQTPMGQAMSSKLMPAPSYGQFLQQANLATQPLTSKMGLSSEGKYGGFYTASDLDKAIQGETMARNEELLDYASSLRQLAQKQRGQLGQQVGQRLRTAQGTQSFMGPVGPRDTAADKETQAYAERRMAELSQGETLAEQIEATPMSQLAQAIATRKYGVNPALAAGMYGPQYDIETGKTLRDMAYYEPGQTYGYQDFLAEEERAQQDLADMVAEAKRTQDPNQLYAASGYSQDVRDLYYNQLASDDLGMNAAKLFSSAQVTPTQGYELLNADVPLPDGGTTDFKGLAASALTAVQAGDTKTAFADADRLSLSEDENTRMLGRLLATYIDSLVRTLGKTGRGLYQYETASDILG